MNYLENDIRDNKSKLIDCINLLSSYDESIIKLIKNYSSLKDDVINAFREYSLNEWKKLSNNKKATDIIINNAKLSFNISNYDEATVKCLYKIIKYRDIYDESGKIYTNYHNELINNIQKAKLATSNSIRWFFASKKTKEESIKAANSLYHLLEETSFVEDIDGLLSDSEKLNGSEDFLDDFKDNYQDYLNMLYLLSNHRVYADDDPQKPDFNIAIKNVSNLISINKNLDDVYVDVDRVKKSVLSNALQLAQNSALEMLKEISIDEIAHKVKGVRIGPLKNEGYLTIADIVYKKEWELSNLRGISDYGASSIVKAVKDIVNNTIKAQKLKINPDSKSKQATELLKSVYEYYINKERYSKINKLHENYSEVINKMASIAGKYFNNEGWFISNINDKKIIYNNCIVADKLCNEENLSKQVEECKEIKRVRASIFNNPWEFFEKQSSEVYSILDELAPGYFGNSDTFYGLPEELAEEIKDECIFPDGLLCTLRRYQEWGVKYILHQKKVLLGDEMGLGKTVQAIATMVSLKNTGAKHFIVVCPASVIINWCREIKTHSKLDVIKVHGQGRESSIKAWIKRGGAAVTTYETTKIVLNNLPQDFNYSMLIVDEAHYVKNPDAIRSRNVVELSKRADRMLYMTGTALENRVDEMVTLMSHLQPSVAKSVESVKYLSTAELFRNRIAPVYYRRKREDVLTELPDLIENIDWISLNEEEKRLYEDNILDKSYMAARRMSFDVNDVSTSSKGNRLLEIIEDAKEDGRKVIVFSFFLDTINAIKKLLGDNCMYPITGRLQPQKRQEIIDEFSNAPAGTTLVCQIQAGGTGLNIQAASVCVIVEPQFKPSIEMQAISRAYRMGQTRNVLVHRLLCENTLEERIREILLQKQAEFDAFADDSVAAQAQEIEINDTTFGDIIKEEINRINKERGIDESINKNDGKENFEYYNELTKLSYEDLVNGLLEKYGPAKYDYFRTEECKSINQKCKRTDEGLIIHHIDEDKVIMLSNEKVASQYPYEYQKADRLVYCNILEHMILHLAIAKEYNNDDENMFALGIGGIYNFIAKILNDFYQGKIVSTEYINRQTELVKNDYETYIYLLNKTWKIIKEKGFTKLCSKELLARGWNNEIYNDILERIED